MSADLNLEGPQVTELEGAESGGLSSSPDSPSLETAFAAAAASLWLDASSFGASSVAASSAGSSSAEPSSSASDAAHGPRGDGPALTLAELPLGAHLVLRCRKDWRDATIVGFTLEQVTLSVRSPTGRTYRLRRPPDSPLDFDGAIPLLGSGSCWRASLARYDARW